MKFVGYILKIRGNPRLYIGMTSRFKHRLRVHRGRAETDSGELYKAIRAAGGWPAVTVEQIATAEDYEAAQILERALIAEYDSVWPNGLNMESGGNRGKVASEETRRRLSTSHIGYVKSEDHCMKQAVSMKLAYDKNDGALRKLRSEQFLGLKKSAEQRAKIGAGNRGKTRSPELRERISASLKAYHIAKRELAKAALVGE